MKVFVYGTLKRGYGNNILLRGAEYLGEGVLNNHILYYSYGKGGFPVSRYNGKGRVLGEVYEIDPDKHLYSLDSLEGYSAEHDTGMYLRREAEIVGTDGSRHNAHFYLGGPRWHFSTMYECPIDEQGQSIWGR